MTIQIKYLRNHLDDDFNKFGTLELGGSVSRVIYLEIVKKNCYENICWATISAIIICFIIFLLLHWIFLCGVLFEVKNSRSLQSNLKKIANSKYVRIIFYETVMKLITDLFPLAVSALYQKILWNQRTMGFRILQRRIFFANKLFL